MTYSHNVSSADTDRDDLHRKVAPTAAAVLLASSALTVYSAHDLTEIVVVIALIAATVAGVYGFLLPRALKKQSAGGMALTFSAIAAALLVPAFWAGLPLVLGVAGAMLGYAGRSARSGAGTSVAAFVLGLLASIGYFAIYVLDTLAQHGIG